ncbi:hypothetical protein GTQ40_03110 [Flavobacteriaceae bacterium R38]|nr:hypothetical protein [Flavobacteriaceae bacterium R38]
MKKTVKIFLCILLSISMTACLGLNDKKTENLSENDFNPVRINNEYVIRIPDYMRKANNLNDDASLQYQNTFRETYIIIIDESKSEFITTFKELGTYNDSVSVIKNYRNVQFQNFEEGLHIDSKSAPRSLIINGLNAETIEFSGQTDDIPLDITYFLTFIEGKNNVYMVMAWTLAERKDKYRNTFEKIVNSFQLIKRKYK